MSRICTIQAISANLWIVNTIEGGHTKLREETLECPEDLRSHLIAVTPCHVRIKTTLQRIQVSCQFYTIAESVDGCTVELVYL